MRLNCPNCGAEYEVPEGMIPPAGRHVQCTACHTRWFVRGAPGTELTEDQILRRLETWSPGPRPVPAPAAARSVAETAPPPEPGPAPDEPVVVHLPPRPAAPAKPADRPAVARPAPITAPITAPTRPQPGARLALGEPATPPAASPPPARSRFGHGFLLGLVLAGLALAAYLYRDPIAARLPQAGPALSAYGDAVDSWREAIETRLGRFRPGAADGGKELPNG